MTFQPDTQGKTYQLVLYENSPTYTTGNPETGDRGNYVLVQADVLTGDSLSPRKWVIKGMNLGTSWKKNNKDPKALGTESGGSRCWQ